MRVDVGVVGRPLFSVCVLPDVEGRVIGCGLATAKVISGWILTCQNARSSQPFVIAPLGDEATDTMT